MFFYTCLIIIVRCVQEKRCVVLKMAKDSAVFVETNRTVPLGVSDREGNLS